MSCQIPNNKFSKKVIWKAFQNVLLSNEYMANGIFTDLLFTFCAYTLSKGLDGDDRNIDQPPLSFLSQR